MKFGLEELLLDKIVSIIGSNEKIKKSVIFGSRARGDYKIASDIDIALYASDDLTSEELNSIRSRIDEIDSIYKIDIIDVRRLEKKTMVENINNEGITIFERRN